MKLTNKQLKQIIQEELRDVMRLQNPHAEPFPEWPFDTWGDDFEEWKEAKEAWEAKKQELINNKPLGDEHGDRHWEPWRQEKGLEIKREMDGLVAIGNERIQWASS
jgi:hypothetical protein